MSTKFKENIFCSYCFVLGLYCNPKVIFIGIWDLFSKLRVLSCRPTPYQAIKHYFLSKEKGLGKANSDYCFTFLCSTKLEMTTTENQGFQKSYFLCNEFNAGTPQKLCLGRCYFRERCNLTFPKWQSSVSEDHCVFSNLCVQIFIKNWQTDQRY